MSCSMRGQPQVSVHLPRGNAAPVYSLRGTYLEDNHTGGCEGVTAEKSGGVEGLQ